MKRTGAAAVLIGFSLKYLRDGDISADQLSSKCAWGAGVDR